ncbi:conserved hypothetical protein [Desulfamplus magnetovallimortis]|uniref:BrxE family protein n=1 Tax=Desulfamplus magnetovallimortis TaxID=1246637 RepID=A0A1W1H543_9BACT|nr:BrxE family protein [Desulfamplus magnetovallimortis]SLM27567.1 conserved hypothetical protein [Desulfamplus magnetovallimortis]
MSTNKIKSIATLRILTGYLGEKGQANWWSSSFFSPTSSSFLNPVFGKTSFIAQYQGVKEAAARVHDEHIGVGEVYHLFRLPENIELSLFQLLHDGAFVSEIKEAIVDKESAEHALSDFIASSSQIQGCSQIKEGPVLMGTIDDFFMEESGQKSDQDSLHDIANLYHCAFLNKVQVIPYFRTVN